MIRRLRLCVASLISLSFFIANAAYAHTRWDPEGLVKPRSTSTAIKSGPCGVARGNNPVTLFAGSTVEVQFESNIWHQGYFRIAFSPANDQGFDDYILAEQIPDYQNQLKRSYSITLPNMTCENCTLQLIQSMLDRNPPSDYFSCADIRLIADPNTDTQAPNPVSQLVATATATSVDLNWTNPSDQDFYGVLVLLAETPINSAPEKGQSYQQGDPIAGAEVIAQSSAETLSISSLNNDTHYYFSFYSYDQSLNYSQGISTDIQTLSQVMNFSPVVSLSAEQNSASVETINTDAGPVLIQANVSDANAEDNHSLVWSASSPAIVDSDQSDYQFTFDPSSLAAGDYVIEVSVSDNGNPVKTTNASITLRVEEEAEETTTGGSTNPWFLLVLAGLSFASVSQRKK